MYVTDRFKNENYDMVFFLGRSVVANPKRCKCSFVQDISDYEKRKSEFRKRNCAFVILNPASDFYSFVRNSHKMDRACSSNGLCGKVDSDRTTHHRD